MALIPFNHPNIDRIVDRDYEAYTDRLYEQAYGDNGERCYNCWHFDSGYSDGKCYCTREDATDEEIEKFTVEIVTKNAEVITSKVDFSVN